MRLLTVAVIALVAGGLSGCIAGDGTITAKQGLGAATDAAKGLTDAVPQLVAVNTLEPLSEYIDEDDDLEIHVHLDKNPGDGKAPGWMYTFVAGDDLIIIGYASGLGVLFEARDGGEVGDEDVEDYVISGWSIDSDDAADILAKEEDWPDMTPSTVAFWSLEQGDECPVWYVEIGDAQEDTWSEFMVDACNGDVLGATEVVGSAPAEPICAERADPQTAITPLEDYQVSIDIEREESSFNYKIVSDFTFDDLHYRFLDPEGNEMVGGSGGGLGGLLMVMGGASGLEPGTYTLHLFSEGAAVSVDIEYSTCWTP